MAYYALEPMYAAQPKSLHNLGGSQQTQKMDAIQKNMTPQQIQQRATQPQQPKDTNQKWQKFIDILKDIKKDLKKGEDKYPHAKITCVAQKAGQITQKL